MAKLSPEQRRELAVMGAKKRWEGKPKKDKKVKPEKRAKRAMSIYTEQERQVMKRVLRDTMSEFSEDFWSAGWYTGCEYVFWAKANDDKEVAAVLPTYPILDDEDKWLLLFASKVAGGWWAWDNDNAFLLMSDWESRYGKWREALLKEARERAEREKEFLEKPVEFPKELPLDEKISSVLQRLLDELPQKRDWLDPELEQTAKYLLTLKKAESEKQASLRKISVDNAETYKKIGALDVLRDLPQWAEANLEDRLESLPGVDGDSRIGLEILCARRADDISKSLNLLSNDGN